MMFTNFMNWIAQDFVDTFIHFGERKVRSHCMARY